MTLNLNTFTRLNVNTLPGLRLHQFKSSQPLDLNIIITPQSLLDKRPESPHESICIMRLHLMTGSQCINQFL